MLTTKQLRRYLKEHYSYELQMINFSYVCLCSLDFGRMENGKYFQNAMIESFCIHARALIDFYEAPQPRKTDLTYFHFSIQPKFGRKVYGSSRYVKLNKQIAHLTEERIGARKINAADREALWKAISRKHAAFVAAIRPEYRDCFPPD
ncbi:hypothetical protein [Sphingomonas sp. 35-24ZXX]|uniref:hypothetical protein n=1 Tax=Sphingomonas sp. 35-24ZXX TaxID=1545915 RepID=UPI0012DFF010|nr:hypothetical protein [Sphingomonas sp. 35-24ZXX]